MSGADDGLLDRLEHADGLAERALELCPEGTPRIVPLARDPYLCEVEQPVEHRHVGECGAAGTQMREHLRPGLAELPAAERRECPGAPLRDLGPVDDRDRDTCPRVEEGHERELGGQAAHVVVDEVADDLDPRRRNRPDGRAKNVEVAGELRVGHVVDAWVERDGPLTLCAHGRFDRIEARLRPRGGASACRRRRERGARGARIPRNDDMRSGRRLVAMCREILAAWQLRSPVMSWSSGRGRAAVSSPAGWLRRATPRSSSWKPGPTTVRVHPGAGRRTYSTAVPLPLRTTGATRVARSPDARRFRSRAPA